MFTALIVLVVVFAIVGVVLYAMFEMSPFAHHAERLREPGKRQPSPRLD